ncbi:MAG: ribonuclease R [Verrucomicrobiota bacterium]
MKKSELKKQILELLGGTAGRSMTKSELARELGIAPKERAEMRTLLDELLASGELKKGKKARFEPQSKAGERGILVGRIRIFPRGHGTVYPDARQEENAESGFDLDEVKRIYVPDRKTGTAMDGDTVAVRVEMKRGRDGEMEAQGAVERIVERAERLVVGVYFNRGGFAYIQPDSEALPTTMELDEVCEEAQNGMKVAVELVEWRQGEDPRGRVKEVIGWPDQPGVDILSVVHKYGLQMEFPERVLDEAHAVAEEVDDEQRRRREDWRDRLVITIDPVDAKDHDDAVWVERQAGGGWKLAVHIADVSHYVKPGTNLDKEAKRRGNSTYLVDRVLPMLPEELSNGICSLRPDEERLTKCAVMEFDERGKMVKAEFVDAFICSQAKLAYEQAQEILDGGAAPARFKGDLKKELEKMVREAWKLASLLRKRRFENGALDLEMEEIKVMLDGEKRATGVVKIEHNESHQLIEEFMLAANEAVAKKLRDRQKPAIYRIHADPDPEKLMEFAELARAHGYAVGDLTNKRHIQDLLDEAVGTPEEHNIKLGLLRSLRRAEYSEQPLGHYGLSKGDYAHFTSPIRRYADLVVHRALQGLLTNPPEQLDRTMKQSQCAETAEHISDTERTSSFAEQETKTLKLLEWLETSRTSESPPIFEGVITEVRSMGMFVEATDIMQKGLVKYEDLPGRGWRFEGGRAAFVGPRGVALQTGMKVELGVVNVDFVEQRVDFEILGVIGDPNERALGKKKAKGLPAKSRKGAKKKASQGRGERKGRFSKKKTTRKSGRKVGKKVARKATKKASKGGPRKAAAKKSGRGRRKR